MTSKQMNTALSALGIFAAALVLMNGALLYAQFRGNGSLSETDMTMLTESPEFETAIDDGIQRYVARQEDAAKQAQADAEKAESEKAKNVPPVTAADHIRGNEDAEIVLIEYSDFDCPFCTNFHATAQEVVENSDGELAWVYRHFPLSIHPEAPKKAEASECVAKLAGEEVFWDFSDELFNPESQYRVADLGELAASFGVNQGEFQECLDSGEMARLVNEQMQSGLNAGINGTPGNILLNVETGEVRKLGGAVPASVVEAAIAELR